MEKGLTKYNLFDIITIEKRKGDKNNDYLLQDESPYRDAEPLLRLSTLARVLNRLQRNGHQIGIVSWLAKNSNHEYDMRVTEAKMEWLGTHLKSVQFDEIHIVEYGTPKQNIVKDKNGILFDDEERNRKNWFGTAYDVDNIIISFVYMYSAAGRSDC